MNTKERPILFNGPMVRALLADRKTQTRRVVKCGVTTYEGGSMIVTDKPCPYGQPGDWLWVRETWAGPLADADEWDETNDPGELENPRFCEYAADGGPKPEYLNADENMVCRWTSSIHMPRWASRITLEITGVRVERLQGISRGDAMAEGCPFPNMAKGGDPCGWYAELWESINGPGSWAANPWVWVIEFKRVKP